MNKIMTNISLLFIIISLGVAGGILHDFWNSGYELQPVWVKFSGGATVLVILLNLGEVFNKEVSRAKRKHVERMQLAIFSVIIFPIVVGFCLFILEDISSQSKMNNYVRYMAMILFAYLPSVINCWYILLEGVIPLWRRHKNSQLMDDSVK